MIRPEYFIDTLGAHGIDFFAGVPDSLLKNNCAYISDHLDERHNIITANEGGAVGLAAGYHLATGNIGCVYMQNSGEGNIINPLASLTDKEVYNIPVLLLIGWRGRPGVHDEPQHIKQGKVTTALLDTMGIEYAVLSKEEEEAGKQIAKAVDHMKATNEVYALIVEKDTFEPYTLQNVRLNKLSFGREEAIQTVAASLDGKDVIVSTTGMISRELFEYRTGKGEGHERDFLTVGSMGHASQIALGIALEQPNRRIWCFDGDGAVIMHMGGMAIIAEKAPKNFVHVVFNNGAHDSVGGQPTVGCDIDLMELAESLGYDVVYPGLELPLMSPEKKRLASMLELLSWSGGHGNNLQFVEVKVAKGARKDLGRPKEPPQVNKALYMKTLAT